jgi:hypothetical protein
LKSSILSDDRAGIADENGGELIHPCKILSNYLQIDRPYWLAWAQIYGVGAITIHRLHDHFGDLASAWYATPAELLEVEGLGNLGIEKICDARKPQLLDSCRSGLSAITLRNSHCSTSFVLSWVGR